MRQVFVFLVFYCVCILDSGCYAKWSIGEINTLEDWQFITRFCFLSAKGTLRFHFEYPISYGPQNILLYFDEPDQWDAVYKSGKSCKEKVSVLDVNNNQIINLTTAYGLSGCTINSKGVYICNGGRIFRSSRERWWFIGVSRCSPGPGDTCAQKVSVLDPDNNQVIYLTSANSLSGCKIVTRDGTDYYVCNGGRRFRSSRERWWYVAVSRCDHVQNTNCTERELVLNPKNYQKIELLPGSSAGCTREIVGGHEKFICSAYRTFSSSRERWWYIAVSHCQPQTPIGINLKYEIHMTNGEEDDYLHREYSADEFYILPIDIAFLIAYVVICALTIICAVMLRMRQLWHTTYKMYMVSVFLWTFYLFLMCLGYGVYGNDGFEFKLRATKYAARAFEAISIMIFLLMLILVAKGYTITRGKLSMTSTVKITVFMSLYTIVYVVIFIWEAIIFDPGLVLYLYESPPGYALVGMRIIGYMWFCYAIFFTLKHYPEKGSFYYPMFVFYTLWFWAGPIVIIIASFAIALWTREKTVVGVENFVAFCGHIFFLVLLPGQVSATPVRTTDDVNLAELLMKVLTRPSAANKNFPYHVRTTQIGILQNVPHQLQTGAPEGTDMNSSSFGAHAYSVSSPMQTSSSGPDLTSLFVTSKTSSESKQKEAETSMNGSSQPVYNSQEPRMVMPSRGRMNSTAQLISNEEECVDEIPDFPVAPTAPPSYQEMFQATTNNPPS